MLADGKQEQSQQGNSSRNFSEFPLIHLDIAGTSMLKKDDFYRLKEGSGSGLRLLSAFLRNLTASYREKK